MYERALSARSSTTWTAARRRVSPEGVPATYQTSRSSSATSTTPSTPRSAESMRSRSSASSGSSRKNSATQMGDAPVPARWALKPDSLGTPDIRGVGQPLPGFWRPCLILRDSPDLIIHPADATGTAIETGAGLNGAAVRMLLIAGDPCAAVWRAVAAGAAEVYPASEQDGWRLGRVRDRFGHHGRSARPLTGWPLPGRPPGGQPTAEEGEYAEDRRCRAGDAPVRAG